MRTPGCCWSLRWSASRSWMRPTCRDPGRRTARNMRPPTRVTPSTDHQLRRFGMRPVAMGPHFGSPGSVRRRHPKLRRAPPQADGDGCLIVRPATQSQAARRGAERADVASRKDAGSCQTSSTCGRQLEASFLTTYWLRLMCSTTSATSCSKPSMASWSVRKCWRRRPTCWPTSDATRTGSRPKGRLPVRWWCVSSSSAS